MKRNDIVAPINSGYVFYGRITHVINDDQVRVIDCGRQIKIYQKSDLELVDYKGKANYIVTRRKPNEDAWKPEHFGTGWVRGEYNWMPSLRRLKQMAARYSKDAWAHKGKRLTLKRELGINT